MGWLVDCVIPLLGCGARTRVLGKLVASFARAPNLLVGREGKEGKGQVLGAAGTVSYRCGKGLFFCLKILVLHIALLW